MDKLIKRNDIETLIMDLEISSKKLIDIIQISENYCLRFIDDSYTENHFKKIDAISFEQKVLHIATIINQIKKLKKVDLNENYKLVSIGIEEE